MIFNTQKAGKEAEEEACLFLKTKGLSLVQLNYRCYHGEIDLIMQDGDDIVFVEVRSRRNRQYGNALESISCKKINKIVKTAKHFLQKKRWLYKVNSRFDIIAIGPREATDRLQWFKNAFSVDKYE